jgi:hypothetical protein
MLGPEPTLIIQTVVATLVALNTTLVATNTINLPSWVSPVISALIVGLGALVNRSQVSPKEKVPTTMLAPIEEPSADLEAGPTEAEAVMPENLNSEEWLAARETPTVESEDPA